MRAEIYPYFNLGHTTYVVRYFADTVNNVFCSPFFYIDNLKDEADDLFKTDHEFSCESEDEDWVSGNLENNGLKNLLMHSRGYR